MMAEDIIERLKAQIEEATHRLRDAEAEAEVAAEAARAALAQDVQLRERLERIVDPAPFIKEELKKSAKAVEEKAQERRRAAARAVAAQKALADLDRAAAQLQGIGLIRQ
jgi:chromosome segregation ATPase